MRARRVGWTAWVAALAAAPAAAQSTDARAAESQALRLAGTLESQSRYGDAEGVLRRLLYDQPTSTVALFALDRVMHAQARPLGALPYARKYLESDPTSAGVRFLELRLLAEGDSLPAAARALDAWIAWSPGDPTPYRDAALLWEQLVGPERTLELLRRGRSAGSDSDLLALEIGDLLHRTGHPVQAADEWARAADTNPDEVVGRVGGIADVAERTRAAARLIAALERGSAATARRMLAARVAIVFGLSDRGLALAKAIAPELPPAEQGAFLEDVTRWADDAGAAAVGAWALAERRRSVADVEVGRRIDARLVRAALEAGDTTTAIAADRRLGEALPRASSERRRAIAERIRLEAGRAEADLLVGELADLRAEYPEAPELDELAALVAEELQKRGQPERAAAVVAPVEGPRSTLERAYLLLAAGDVARGRAALLASVPGLPGGIATAVIQLASLLDRLGPTGGAAVARAAVDAHRGRAREAGLGLERSAGGLPEGDRPAVLAEAARLLEGAGGEVDAARVRGELVGGYPDAAESAEAALALARWRARTQEGRPEAIRMLEDLILRAPDGPIAPAARRELERLRKGA